MEATYDRIDFENIEAKLQGVLNSAEYADLTRRISRAKRVYLIGNGGLHFVACHAATDMSRLIPNKTIHSFDSVGYITSNANDHPWEMLFIRWLETITLKQDDYDTLVIGMSCSGKSKNILNTLDWANGKGIDTFMISGKSSGHLDENTGEIDLQCNYFHTVEVISLMIFYDLIHATGNRCPSIDQEIRRKQL
jgi:D-sedoheptulose 7-phosphate isomerase